MSDVKHCILVIQFSTLLLVSFLQLKGNYRHLFIVVFHVTKDLFIKARNQQSPKKDPQFQ